MLKLLKCEFWKLKRKGLLKAATATAFIFPALDSALMSEGGFSDIISGVREESGFILLIPLLVVMAAHLFFEEHDSDTLKNLACIPVSKNQLATAKIGVLLIFSVFYELCGFIFGMLLAVFKGVPLTDLASELLFTLGTGVFLTAAALPCVILVVWFNKSYIISVIIAFFYMLLNYALHLSDAVMMKPIGFNIATFLPVPVIFRWLYQYKMPEGRIQTEFFERLQPYFVPLPACCLIMAAEAVLCTALIIKVYRHQEN